MSTPTTLSTPFPLSAASLKAALAGAAGGFASFFFGDLTGAIMGMPEMGSLLGLILYTSFWSAIVGLVIGASILVYDNSQSLRGQWHRDLAKGSVLFFALSFVGGALGQFSYSFIQNSVTRGIGWALIGASIGAGIGVLRHDKVQAQRGALGGVIGGFVGGLLFDWLAMHSVGGDALSRFVGQILMGALIALLMRVVQEALKSAWLLGISSGPFEGKEYPLNVARVSVGRAQYNDISLFREESTQPHVGALLFNDGNWWWQGEAIGINGVPQSNAALNSGDTLQIGATRFRFQNRSKPEPVSMPVPHYEAQTSVRQGPQTLELVTSGGQILTWDRWLTTVQVGRAAHNQLVLADPTVSSSHAILQVSGGQLSVTDQGSTNGTFVNGQKLGTGAPHPLAEGDHVRFGNLEAVVRVSGN